MGGLGEAQARVGGRRRRPRQLDVGKRRPRLTRARLAAFDPDARARAERAAAVAAAAERKAVERMEAARSRRRTNGGGQSGRRRVAAVTLRRYHQACTVAGTYERFE